MKKKHLFVTESFNFQYKFTSRYAYTINKLFFLKVSKLVCSYAMWYQAIFVEPDSKEEELETFAMSMESKE